MPEAGLSALAPRLDEADPLPPDDRVPPARGFGIAELYRAEAPRLLRFFKRRFHRQEADDLLQESFARLARAGAAPDVAIDCPQAYLSTIASNVARDRARTALQRSLADPLPADEAGLAGPDMVAALEARDELNRLQQALSRLPARTRQIFLAHRLDGLSYKEIAKDIGLSVKGVEWHMSKAIAHLDRFVRQR